MSYITGFSKTHVFVNTEDGRIRKFLLKRIHYEHPRIGDRVEFCRPAEGGDWYLDLEEGYVRPETQDDVSQDEPFDFTAFFSRNAIEEAEKKKEAEDALKADQEREDELSKTFVGKMKNLFH